MRHKQSTKTITVTIVVTIHCTGTSSDTNTNSPSLTHTPEKEKRQTNNVKSINKMHINDHLLEDKLSQHNSDSVMKKQEKKQEREWLTVSSYLVES